MTNPPKLLVFDATNLIYRSFHGNEKLTGPDGTPTGAISAFLVTMGIILKQYPDYQPVFVFDAFPAGAIPGDELEKTSSRPVYGTVPSLEGSDYKSRRDLYPEYKANRSPMPPELVPQMWPLLLILSAMGHPMVVGNSIVEGDDVQGTLIIEVLKRGGSSIVATTDKDLAALVNANCRMYNFNAKAAWDAKGVEEKYGVPPERISGWLALMGDDSDNIPGVEKCGEKTAAKWMNTYDTFEGVLANADKIKGVVGDNLKRALPLLPLSYSLTLLRTDLPIDFEAATRPQAPDIDFLRHLYIGLGMKRALKLLDDVGMAELEEAHGVPA
jgi:DNA polymerase-1